MENVYKFAIYDGRIYDTNSSEVLLLIPELTGRNVSIVKSMIKDGKYKINQRVNALAILDTPIEDKIVYLANASNNKNAFAHDLIEQKVYKVKYWENVVKDKVKSI